MKHILETLLQKKEFHVYGCSAAYKLAKFGKIEALRVMLEHDQFDVNKICSCCNNILPIEAFNHVQSFHDENDEVAACVKLLHERGADISLCSSIASGSVVTEQLSDQGTAHKSRDDRFFRRNLQVLKVVQFH